MKPLLTLAILFNLANNISFAQDSLASKPASNFSKLNGLLNLPLSSPSAEPCNNPTGIACGQTLYNLDNMAANGWSNNFNAPAYGGCGINPAELYTSPDRLFKFTVSLATTVYIDLNNVSGVDLDIFLLSSCAPAVCKDRSINPAPSDESIEVFLNPGTYYIVVDGWNGSQGLFNLSLQFSGGCPGGCDDPPVLLCSQTISNQTNLGSSGWSNNFNHFSYSNCGFTGFGDIFGAPDRLFKFEVSSITTVTISLDIISNAPDLDLLLLSDCSPANCIAKSINFPPLDETIQIQLNPGTYYIVVDGWNNAQGAFNLSLEFDQGCLTICNNPSYIDCGQTLTNQHNFSGGGWKNNFNAFSYTDCGVDFNEPYQAPDRMYQFEVTTAATVNISMDIHLGSPNLDMFLLAACSPTLCIAKSTNNFPLDESIVTYLNAGLYYIVVDGWNNAQGYYDLSLQCGGSGDCSNPANIACGQLLTGQSTTGQQNKFSANAYSACGISGSAPYNAPDKLYKFTLNSAEEVNISMEVLTGGANLDLYLLSSCSPATCIDYSNKATSFESIQTYLAAGTYYILVDGYDNAQGDFNLQMSCNCSCIEELSLGDLRSCESFENYPANAPVSPNSVRWNKWSGSVGDALVQNGAASKYLELKGSANPTPNVWFNFGPSNSGRYRLSFRMKVEAGKNGNYYVLHQAPNGSGANANTAYRVVFNADGNGFLKLALSNNNAATFKYPNGEWMDVAQIIDLDQNVAELWVAGEFVHSWPFDVGSNGSLLRLEALNFDASNASFSYQLDDICLRIKDPCINLTNFDPVCVENGTQVDNPSIATCELYTTDEYQPCNTICEYGGKFIYRGDNFSGSFDASDRAPWSVRSQPCVDTAYGGNLPLNLYADIYVFSRQDNKEITINFSDNDNPNVRAFVFVCNAETALFKDDPQGVGQPESGFCQDGEYCWETLVSGGSVTILPNICHNFYYIVITGTLGETYSNLSIIPTGNCPTDPELIQCGDLITGAVGSQNNPPPIPFESSGEPYLQCYNGFRDYTGDESFYKLVLTQPSKITVKLTASAPNPSPMGVFLFSFLCGGNCLGYAENTVFDPSATLTANLSEGIYYLVADKGTNAGNSNFTLNLNCEQYSSLTTYNAFIIDDFVCPTDATASPHAVKLLYNSSYDPTDYFEFYFRDNNMQLKGNLESNKYWHNSTQPLTFDLRPDEVIADNVKCSYMQGDTFYVFMHQTEEGKSTFKQYRPTYASVSGGGATETLKFNPGGLSIITKLTEINAINFVPEFSTITALPEADTRYMIFSSGQAWAVEELSNPVSWLTVTPTHSTTAQTLSLIFEENTSPVPRSVVLRFYTTANPGLYQQFVLVTQQGRCEIPQPVNIVANNNNICAGTPITLTADVGASYVDLYNYLWSNGSTETSISVTPTAPVNYSVTVTNKYCFITSDNVLSISVTPLPNAPLPANNASMCQGQPTTPAVSVGTQPSGVQVFWYGQATGGSPLSPVAGNTYTPVPPPSVTTTYYAESVKNGCKSTGRTPVILTVNPKPSFATTDTICSVNLLTYTVVTTISNGNTVTTTPVFPVTFNPANGTYTISNIPKGTNLTLTVTNTSTTCSNTKLVTSPACLCSFVNAPTTNSPQSYCPGTTPPLLTATVGNGEIAEWYASQTSQNPIGSGPVFQASNSGIYWVQSRNNATQCVSPRIAVQLIALARPSFEILNKTCAPDLNSYDVRFHTDAGSAIAPPYLVTDLLNGNFEILGITANQPVNIHLVAGITSCQRDTLVPPAFCGCPPNIPKPTTNSPFVNPCEGTTMVPPLTVQVPNGMSVNWYLNGQLQFGSPNTSLQASLAGDYWAKTYNPLSHCESLDSTKVTLQYKPLPTLIEVSKDCDVSWQNYQVTVSSSTATLSSSPGITPTNNGNGSYTFAWIPIASPITITATANGCSQAITVQPHVCSCTVLPDVPKNPNNPSMCLGGNIPLLTVTVDNPGTEIVDWYDVPSGGVPLMNNSPITTQYQPTTAVTTTDYYAQARSVQHSDCISARTKVTLRVDFPATAYAGADATICGAQTFALSGSLGGSASTGTWSATPLGGNFSPNSSFLQAQSYTPSQNFQSGTITISLTAFPAQPSVCPSATDKMLLTVNEIPTLVLLSEECEPDLDHYFIRFNTNGDDIEFIPNIGIFGLDPDGSYSYRNIPEGIAVSINAKFVSTDCTHNISPPAKTCNCPTNFQKPTWLGDKEVCEGSTQFPTLEVNVPPGFTVDWYDAPAAGLLLHANDATYENPPGPDEYWAEARDTATNCTSFERTLVKLEIAPNPIANAGPDLQTCTGSGNLTITADQSGANDSYSWSNGQIGPIIQVPAQSATYYLTVTLGNCIDKDTVNVSLLPGIASINFNQTNIHCNGGNDGSLTAVAVGSGAPFNFLWSNGHTEQTIIALPVGIYTVTVTNAQNCSSTASATISQPMQLALANASVQNATNNLNNGSIQVNITGGTQPYQYQWLYLNNSPIGGQNASLIDSIYGDNYKVRVTDANGCIFISNPIFVDNVIVGTDEPSLASQIQVFPNPTTGRVFLKFNLQAQEDAKIEVFDLLGRLLVQEQKRVHPSDVFEIDLSDMPSSIYLLKISMEKGTVVTKNVFVKK